MNWYDVKINKIVGKFVKIVDALRNEVNRLDALADEQRAISSQAAVNAEFADTEATRAAKIANNLEGLINVG